MNSATPVSVVTGAAGFLGSHLTDRLLAEGHRVIGLDNLITGTVANLSHLAGDERFRFIKQDVTSYLYLPDDIDYVFHFASPASPVDYLEYPIQTLKVGSLGTHNALGLAREKNATFLLASTSECYGDPLVHPQPEDYWGNVNPVGTPRVLRRGEAVRRGAHHGLPPDAWDAYPHRPDLQYLRPAHAPARRPRGAQFHSPGAQGRAIDDPRRREPDPLVLLRG